MCDQVGILMASLNERRHLYMTMQINIPTADETLLHRIAAEHHQTVAEYVIHLVTWHCRYLHENLDLTIAALKDYSYASIPEMAAELVQSATDSHRILSERRR